MPSSVFHDLLVEVSNFNEQLNSNQYSIPAVDWKVSVRTIIVCTIHFKHYVDHIFYKNNINKLLIIQLLSFINYYLIIINY